MKITKSKLKKLISESWASYGVNPVDFLIDYFEAEDELYGTDEIIDLLKNEGWDKDEIDSALNDTRLDDFYEPRDDAWGISEVPYAGPGDGATWRGTGTMHETDGKSKRVGGGQTWSDEEPEGDELNEVKMKITKRQLRRIIREEVAVLKEYQTDQDILKYVRGSLEQHWKKKNRGFMRNRKFIMPANQIMDALWIDDVWQADIDELEKIVARNTGSLDELSADVALWLAQIRKGGYSTPESQAKEMATWRKV